jgi:hypothetical protein
VRSCDNAVVASRTERPSAQRAGAAFALGAVAVGLALTGCGNDGGGDAERFCGEVAANKDALTNPTLTYADDIEPLLDLYRTIGDLAPLAIEGDWNQLVTAYETASTVVPGDTESEQAALAVIYSSEKSAAAIDRWLVANCAVDIGPVFTIVPQGPVVATTLAPVPDTTLAP